MHQSFSVSPEFEQHGEESTKSHKLRTALDVNKTEPMLFYSIFLLSVNDFNAALLG